LAGSHWGKNGFHLHQLSSPHGGKELA
jgi:hypothetical protein